MTDQTESLRLHLTQRDKTDALVDYFVQRTVTELRTECREQDDLGFAPFYETHLKSSSKRNTETIYKSAESPIELAFLNSLHLCFIKAADLNVHFSESTSDHLRFMNEYSSFYQQLDARYDEYMAKHPNATTSEFISKSRAVFLDVEGYAMPAEMQSRIENHLIIRRTFFHNDFHLTLQPKLPTVKHVNSGMRPDLFIWVPTDSTIRYAIECDGYKYHSEPESFTKDRQRDRILESYGIATLRFSGYEIHHDPQGTASELFSRLQELYDKHFLGPQPDAK